ncbi:carbamate kinase [Faecalicatena contorta]|uniref:Carbamate kinase n=1 Tax=Faecalicatena contorta TaxID=39482 RepID=A0A315ZTX6_9FIRM|nr:carbamate kinase [Faecalicatena contorta]PWJ48762.1 carbamate kinase [Faecalicatena contorta]SUQ15185.1 carbamate kinase [Faecalicatena contorta]
MKEQVVVIALGGNALGYNYEEQRKAVEGTALIISDLIEEGFKVVLTHGNGPQVGMIQTAMDELNQIYSMYTQVPMPSCVAMSQGYIAFELQRAIKAELEKRNIQKNIVSILTQVGVDANDPAFEHPTKPIGRFMSKEEARIMEKQGLKCMEDAGRGYRLTVASPKPKKIIELDVIQRLIDEGDLVIACGGGGIPVAEKGGELEGISAVIDKDFVSALLAKEIGADFLVILTAVEKIAINFGKKNQQWLESMSLDEADAYIKQEQFAPGSMLPKVEAAMEFAASGMNRRALITLLGKAREGLLGKTGTVIYK